ncbi:polysaccharide deacetylase family protein [Paenibacillus sp. KS-LC4]|uniref:polysaccharide deacetylase family protein n=1 Tax=Paenibacillus sp. KS-LC4 TaxID=2979727 RepID=UPI0030CBB00F
MRKLGSGIEERLLIINADDFGITGGTNAAIIDLFEQKAITSASIMMPCSAAREAIEKSKEANFKQIGIHLTLNSDKNNGLRPVFKERVLSSLVTEQGYFYNEISQVEIMANPEEVKLEFDAQIQNAILLGIDPTHLDSHGGSIMGLHTGRDFLDIIFDLCEKYCLPFNLPLRILEQPFFNHTQKEGFKSRIDTANKRGIMLIDDMVSLPYCQKTSVKYEELKQQFKQIIKNIRPGITQLTVHPALITNELKALTHCYSERELEYFLLKDDDILRFIKREGIRLLSWKAIRDLQRNMN